MFFLFIVCAPHAIPWAGAQMTKRRSIMLCCSYLPAHGAAPFCIDWAIEGRCGPSWILVPPSSDGHTCSYSRMGSVSRRHYETGWLEHDKEYTVFNSNSRTCVQSIFKSFLNLFLIFIFLVRWEKLLSDRLSAMCRCRKESFICHLYRCQDFQFPHSVHWCLALSFFLKSLNLVCSGPTRRLSSPAFGARFRGERKRIYKSG
jgi:hypothetical protein